MGKQVVVTGGAGFIGSAYVRTVLDTDPSARCVSFDALTYAGHERNLEGLDPERHRLVRGDVAEASQVARMLDDVRPDAVVHIAAETHVDRGLRDPQAFIRTNVRGTQVMLDACAARDLRLVLVSTDEVYGDLPAPERATPQTPLRPNNVYAATKAAGDLLAAVAFRTRAQDVVVTRSTNNYGPRQLPEKLIPLMILRASAGESLPVYGDGRQQRDWLHVTDHARGIQAALEQGTAGRIYHFGARALRTNLAVVERIVETLGARAGQITHVADRPAHDRRYALDDEATRTELGWAPAVGFDAGLAETIAWYQAHAAWCRAVAGEDLCAFLAANYGDRPGHESSA